MIGLKKETQNKNVIFSFDDGRKDTYNVAYKIMKKNKLVGTIHVITKYLDNGYNKKIKTDKGEFVSIDDLYDMKKNGFEISSHSDDHSNDYNMIKKSLIKLVDNKLMDKNFLTFSSPHSDINQKNYMEYKIQDLNLKYIRTGIQMKNEKFLKKIAYFFQKFFKSKIFFYYLHKDNIISEGDNIFFIKTVTIRRYNTVNQIKYLIKKMKCNQTVVLLFHSINVDKKNNNGNWGYPIENFKKLCEFVSQKKEIKNYTIKEFVKKYSSNMEKDKNEKNNYIT